MTGIMDTNRPVLYCDIDECDWFVYVDTDGDVRVMWSALLYDGGNDEDVRETQQRLLSEHKKEIHKVIL